MIYILFEWRYHVECIFEMFRRARATTKKIEDAEDIDGFDALEKDDRKRIIKEIDELQVTTNREN